ncbi:Cys-tRNA(Pro) deacylase [Thalassotalea psychrophila]|uniref:Cys-tRNA(Pro)/Cys-tRNA(Cys) deacylase n=1 Tax=Thalassotalea psychrophila TaxID=3065647 RepID=A0ABY9TNR6_9GAMM|nr:Cys-tRNA(Pro) deacylase [Colwelliaceae bacterium SQ149]
MTPAINLAIKYQIDFEVHQYIHDVNAASYGIEAAEKLNIEASRVFKTLVVVNEQNKLLVAIVPVEQQLNLKLFAKASKSKRVSMAEPKTVERSTGYVLGGVSPLGQKRLLTTVIDQSAEQHQTIYVSAGKRGLEIELAPKDLSQALNATFVTIT